MIYYDGCAKYWFREDDVQIPYTKDVQYINGCKYILGRLCHREDGPAMECDDGGKEWIRNGKRHREDGPAVIYWDGHSEYFINGVCHREDGPAVEVPDELLPEDDIQRLYTGDVKWINGQLFIKGKLCHREDGIVPSQIQKRICFVGKTIFNKA